MLGGLVRIAQGAALCLSLWTGPAPGADAPVQLAPDQMRNAAAPALRAGLPDQALAFSDAFVQRDPTDRTALLIRARAHRDLGAFKAAKSDARAAWKLAETKDQK